ncbi:hypothetical protein V1389_04390 [Flavobacterium rakeshii]|uniref:hypothetical protein n=1 Tax=Flavobacterium rakeshii TaxID=1038845 RepID=UPI002E7BCF27|nr:hypothetical protein [Flavobacterium rakeshii]MEE1897561.1 hypothetical protein [Flavobacterium rakeshii]
MFIVQRYAHIYYIPFFPTEKKAFSECSGCNHFLHEIQFSEKYKNGLKEIKSQIKTPLWMYTGLGIIALIIIAVFISGKQNDSENAELLLSPQKGDIYEIKLPDNQYTIYKVDKVEGNTVYFFENEYMTDRLNGVEELSQKPFTTKSYPVMKTDLKVMLENGEIIDIERPE